VFVFDIASEDPNSILGDRTTRRQSAKVLIDAFVLSGCVAIPHAFISGYTRQRLLIRITGGVVAYGGGAFWGVLLSLKECGVEGCTFDATFTLLYGIWIAGVTGVALRLVVRSDRAPVSSAAVTPVEGQPNSGAR